MNESSGKVGKAEKRNCINNTGDKDEEMTDFQINLNRLRIFLKLLGFSFSFLVL